MLEKHPEYFEGRTNLALKTKWKKLNLTSNRVLLDELRKTIEVSNIKQSIKKKSEKRKTNNKKKFKKWSDLDTKNIVACQKNMDPNGPASYKHIHTFLNSETEPVLDINGST